MCINARESGRMVKMEGVERVTVDEGHIHTGIVQGTVFEWAGHAEKFRTYEVLIVGGNNSCKICSVVLTGIKCAQTSVFISGCER